MYFEGCPNTPAKGMRYCQSHDGIVRKYIDEKNCIEDFGKKAITTDEDLMIVKIVKILNNKMTRQGNFCEVSLLCRGFKLSNVVGACVRSLP